MTAKTTASPRPGGVPYLHIPAPDPARPAAFYRAAFAWGIRDDEDSGPSRTAPAT